MDQYNLDPACINVMKLLRRRCPKCLAPKRFKYYSWLRLKSFANEVSTIDTVLSSEELFVQLLKCFTITTPITKNISSTKG